MNVSGLTLVQIAATCRGILVVSQRGSGEAISIHPEDPGFTLLKDHRRENRDSECYAKDLPYHTLYQYGLWPFGLPSAIQSIFTVIFLQVR